MANNAFPRVRQRWRKIRPKLRFVDKSQPTPCTGEYRSDAVRNVGAWYKAYRSLRRQTHVSPKIASVYGEVGPKMEKL